MGRHEFDVKLPDFSRQGLDREIARLHSEREHAPAFANDTLDQRQRFERDYMLAVIDGQLFWLEKAQDPYRNPSRLLKYGRLTPGYSIPIVFCY